MMLLPLALIIWLMGSRRKITFWGSFAPLIGLWLLALGISTVLPQGSMIRVYFGSDPRFLAIVGGIGVILALYWAALRAIHRRTKATLPVAQAGIFTRAELARYSRHILLREIGGAGQARLKSARVLVVGAGGLGSPALMYLTAAGVGTIGVIDDDLVEESNLARQIIHMSDALGLPKVQSAKETLNAQNPHVLVLPYHRKLDETSQSLIAEYDLILDGTDSMETRYLVNRAAVAAGRPLISAALTQWEGQISLYHPPNAPCYACIFPAAPQAGLAPACAEAGVLSPLPGVIGAMMAVEAVKHITGAGETLAGRLMIYDALDAQIRSIKIARNPNCPVCGQAAHP
jgi:molybdopterin/thiamine biosynthesis adenylyltransferase